MQMDHVDEDYGAVLQLYWAGLDSSVQDRVGGPGRLTARTGLSHLRLRECCFFWDLWPLEDSHSPRLLPPLLASSLQQGGAATVEYSGK